MMPKKTVLKVTPNVPTVRKTKPKKNEYLRECFQTIIDRELLHMNVKKVNDILINDVHVNLKSLPYRLQCVLAECLCHYMKVWPGWAKFEQHSKTEKTKRDYFEKFRQYLSFKMNYIIQNENSFWNDPAPDSSTDSNKVSREVQTDTVSKSHKPEAPYNLVISGQPNVLNNIVFIEVDNNIVIKQHAEKPWKTLTIPEFLNYSFVYAEVTLPDIHLSRSNLHEFQRYITECGDTATCPDVDFITYVRKTNRNVEGRVYTFNYLSTYFAQFLEVMRQVPGVNKPRINELEEIFKEFLKDIQATNLHGLTMATCTSVCFNIGGNRYIRNKKMVVNNQKKKDTNAINFCEILIPRTSYTLHEFTAEEDPSTEYATFKSLNEILCLIKKGKASDFYPILETINNCVSYQCILCPKIYQGDHAYVEMLDHFRFLHKGEQSVLCFKCRRQFEVPKLSGDRWAHVCEPKPTTAPVSTTTTSTSATTITPTASNTTVTPAITSSVLHPSPLVTVTSNSALLGTSSDATGTSTTAVGTSDSTVFENVGTSTISNTVIAHPNGSIVGTASNNIVTASDNAFAGITVNTVVNSSDSTVESLNTMAGNSNDNIISAPSSIILQTPVSTPVYIPANAAIDTSLASNCSSALNNMIDTAINSAITTSNLNIASVSTGGIVNTVPDNTLVGTSINTDASTSLTPLTGILFPLNIAGDSSVTSISNGNVCTADNSVTTEVTTAAPVTANNDTMEIDGNSVLADIPTTNPAEVPSTDLFADFSVEGIATRIAEGINAGPITNLINETPAAIDTDSATAINIASIMEHITF